MSGKAIRRIKFTSSVLLVVGLVSATVGYSLKRSDGVKRKAAIGFTLVTKETSVPFAVSQPESPMELSYAISVRQEKPDGSWKGTRTYYRAGKAFKEDITFGIPGEGVFQADQASANLQFVSSMQPKEETSTVPVRNYQEDEHFLREDVVQGYRTYVLRFIDQEGGYMDLYRAPDLNDRTIRRVTVSTRGMSVEEPIQITLGTPGDEVFKHLPKWPVRFERYQQKINSLEDSGVPETVEAMRLQLKREIEKRSPNH